MQFGSEEGKSMAQEVYGVQTEEGTECGCGRAIHESKPKRQHCGDRLLHRPGQQVLQQITEVGNNSKIELSRNIQSGKYYNFCTA